MKKTNLNLVFLEFEFSLLLFAQQTHREYRERRYGLYFLSAYFPKENLE